MTDPTAVPALTAWVGNAHDILSIVQWLWGALVAVMTGVVGLAVWMTRVTNRVANLEIADPRMTAICEQHRQACDARHALEIGHMNNNIQDIKDSVVKIGEHYEKILDLYIKSTVSGSN